MFKTKENANYFPEPRLCSFVPAQFETGLFQFPVEILLEVSKTSREHFYRVKPCSNDTEAGVVEETIRIKELPGNEHDSEPTTTIARKLEAAKTQLSPRDQVFVNVSVSTKCQSPLGTEDFQFLFSPLISFFFSFFIQFLFKKTF